MKKSNELLNTPQTPQELHDQRTRTNDAVEQILGNKIYTKIDDLRDNILASSDNPYQLGRGRHAGIRHVTDGDVYIGTAGTIIDPSIISSNVLITPNIISQRIGSLYVKANSSYSNMRFTGVVTIGSLSNLTTTPVSGIFTNCVFDGPVQVQGFGIFMGCRFNYGAGYGPLVRLGVAGNVYIMGCLNTSGQVVVAVPVANIFGLVT